jgi:HAMP domain-containing protein
VLEILLGADGAVVSTSELLERAWDDATDPFTNAVRMTVSRLRARLGPPEPGRLPDRSRPMTLLGLSGRLAHALRHPRTTVRWRLTLLYTTLFLSCGAALLVITYGLVTHATSRVSPGFLLAHHPELRLPHPPARAGLVHQRRPSPAVVARLLHSHAGRTVVDLVGRQQRIVDLHQLVIEAAIALALMALLSAALGWIVAGRVLAPLRTMTAQTRSISEDNLHARLALSGPPDELRQLADTIDALLARLEGAFDAQRRFVANASHELRTPLTAMRALLEMVLTDPAADVETFRGACEQVLQESADQEQLIDALLMLARGQRGLDRREPLDLSAIAADVLMAYELEAAARGVRVHSDLAPAPIAGGGVWSHDSSPTSSTTRSGTTSPTDASRSRSASTSRSRR